MTNTIIKKLERAKTWLATQQSATPTDAGADRVKSIIESCVILLGYSMRDYGPWLNRHDRRKRIKGKYTSPRNNKAIRDLIDLVVSDIEACAPFTDYIEPWQLEDWATGTYVCEQCGTKFGAKRQARFCCDTCRVRFRRKCDPEHGEAA